jgi:tetratricopeptide (TPR) repeat protein
VVLAQTSPTRLETYKDLISKARNLTLQRDRLQASQILCRGLQREPKNSVAYKELSKALDDLSGVFYTEKAQSLFSLGESLEESKPKEAIDKWSEALRLEEGNVTLLNSISRAHLRQDECSAAEPTLHQAQNLNPISTEIKLLQMQLLECQKKYEELAQLMSSKEGALGENERFGKSLFLKVLWKQGEIKKAKNILANWETSAPDYPEVYFWRWQVSGPPPSDREDALKYANLCKNLTVRKKKSYNLDLELCKSKERIEGYLKDGATDSGVGDE